MAEPDPLQGESGVSALPSRTALGLSKIGKAERADEDLGKVAKFLRRMTVRLNWLGKAQSDSLVDDDVAAVIAGRQADGLQTLDALPPADGHLPQGARRLAYLQAADAAAQQVLGLTPHPNQLRAAIGLIDEVFIEMDTGEGKSLVAALAGAVAALAGVPTHIVTVNDYLAERDAEKFTAYFAALGLSVDWVGGDMEPPRRKESYGADIVYAANKELTFDYLRDRVADAGAHDPLRHSISRFVGKPGGVTQDSPIMQRGLHFAIVDEADSVLVDEARVPLILSASVSSDERRDHYEGAIHIARHLVEGDDYTLDLPNRQVQLLQEAEFRIAQLARGTILYRGARRRHMLVVQALAARHLFLRDRDYMVKDDEIVIIDENTGRAMPDRAWDADLQASIEVKEKLPLSDGRRTMAQISFQRFFRRYLHLTGLTGTAQEVAGESLAIYRRKIQRIDPHRPNQREILPAIVRADQAEKLQAIVDDVRTMRAAGRPILIGTRTVDVSEQVAACLADAAIPAVVLNARQDEQEAEIVAAAGDASRVTIATNMAGRGTDIALSEEARSAGGLHVILTEFHDSGRIDRQLIGRAARQGDPGSARTIVALDDDLLRRYSPRLQKLMVRYRAWMIDRGKPADAHLVRGYAWAQKRAERLHGQARLAMLEMDEEMENILAVAGKGL